MTGCMQQFKKHLFNSIKLLVLLAFLHVAFYTSAQTPTDINRLPPIPTTKKPLF